MKRKPFYWVLLMAVLLLSSCGSSKKFVYLQDMELGHGYPYDTKYEAVVHLNDRLDITVSSKSPELAIPFNANSGSFSVTTDGAVTESSTAKKRVTGWMWTGTSISPSWASCTWKD